MATKHMNAAPGDFAETVLMPGDPLRAQYIAENWFEAPRRVTDVRNMWGYTGTYKGLPVSVMAHGMGIPSASIYWSELIEEYGVKRIIRVGSCGTSHPEVRLRDVIIAMGACTDSGVNRMRFGGFDLAALATFSLVRHAVDAALEHDVRYHVGNIFSADLFYAPDTGVFDTMETMGVLAVEMEAAELYTLAARHGVRALAVLTVSDHLVTGEALPSEDRERSFGDMIEIDGITVIVTEPIAALRCDAPTWILLVAPVTWPCS